MDFFLNYRLQTEKEFKYTNLLRRDLNILIEEKEKPLIKVDSVIYEELKDLYGFYNFDCISKSFTEGIYSKYKFENLKIISHRELKSALPEFYEKANQEISNKNKKNKLNNNFFYGLYLLNFDIPSNKNINKNVILENKPITWNLFNKVFEDLVIEKNLNQGELDINLRHFEKRLKKKELDFEYYSEMYRKTKRNLFYSMIRDLLFSTRDTNTSVLE